MVAPSGRLATTASIWDVAPEPGIPEPPALVADSEHLWLAYYRAASDLIAVVRFSGVIDYRLSSINDEGLGKHPYAGAGLRFYSFNELRDSEETLQWAVLGARHWVITFKDNTLDVVASSAEVVAPSVTANSPLEALLAAVARSSPRASASPAITSPKGKVDPQPHVSVAKNPAIAQHLQAPLSGDRVWFGYGDFVIRQGDRTLSLPYVSEPRFGDSQHRICFENWTAPGLAWGSGLAWSPESRYVLVDWAAGANVQQRITVALDLQRKAVFEFPECIPFKRFVYPMVFGEGIFGAPDAPIFEFTGKEEWIASAVEARQVSKVASRQPILDRYARWGLVIGSALGCALAIFLAAPYLSSWAVSRSLVVFAGVVAFGAFAGWAVACIARGGGSPIPDVSFSPARLSIAIMLVGAFGIFEYMGKKTENLSAALILFCTGLVGWLILRKRRE
jgi:hypothetical protein